MAPSDLGTLYASVQPIRGLAHKYFSYLLSSRVPILMANIGRKVYYAPVDEGRKRVIGIIAGIIMARNLDRADDLFGGPQGSPRTDKLIAAAVQWAELIMRKIDSLEKQRAAQN